MLSITEKTINRSYNKILQQILDDNYTFDANSTNEFTQLIQSTKNIIKDIPAGVPLRIESVNSEYGSLDKKFIQVNFANGLTGFINTKQEIKFLSKVFNQPIDTVDDLNDLFVNYTVYAVQREESADNICSVRDGWLEAKHTEFKRELNSNLTENKIYYAHIYDRNAGGYFCTVDGVQVYMPGSLAAANKITNFDTLLGKVVPVMIENYLPQTSMYIVSNKKYIQKILPEKAEAIQIGDSYTGKVTGITDYAIFVEFDSIFTGMLHVSELDAETSRKSKARELIDGDEISFYIKSINRSQGNIKFTLTQKTQAEINDNEQKIHESYVEFQKKCEGSIQKGQVIYLKKDYAFVSFNNIGYNVRGLLSSNELQEYVRNGISIDVNKVIDIFISRVSQADKKIYLKYPIYNQSK